MTDSNTESGKYKLKESVAAELNEKVSVEIGPDQIELVEDDE